MKLASLTVAHNEEDLIGGCLDLLDVDFKLVIIPKRTFSGIEVLNADKTNRIAYDRGASVVYVDIASEAECRNFGLKLLNKMGYDYALIVDADEWWSKEAIKDIKNHIELLPVDAYKAKLDFFFKRPTWKIEGMRNDRAIVCIRTDKKFNTKYPRRFYGAKLIDIGTIYHFSYVRTPEKIKEKLESFSHSKEVDLNWYDDVYMKINLDSKNFHPVNPEEYPKLVEVQIPDYIKNKIPKHLW